MAAFIIICYLKLLLSNFSLYIVDSVSNSADTGSVLIGNLDIKHALELHKKFYSVKRICTKIIGEVCAFGNL